MGFGVGFTSLIIGLAVWKLSVTIPVFKFFEFASFLALVASRGIDWKVRKKIYLGPCEQ